MKTTPLAQKIDGFIRPAVESLGFSIVRIRINSQRGQQVLQIMAEPAGGEREMTVQDCAQVSRHVSAILDVEDPISGAYNLEVSSPGIDRPLNDVEDFTRYIGHEANIELEWPQDGRKRFKGEIISVEEKQVRLRLDAQNEALLNIADIQQAKLALTERLIAEHLKKFPQPGVEVE